MLRSAGLDIRALIALAKACFAGAGQGRERPLNGPDDGADRNLVGRLRQHVTATFALLARNESTAFEGHQNLLQELLGDGLVVSQVGNQLRSRAIGASKRIERAQAVLRAFRKLPHELGFESSFARLETSGWAASLLPAKDKRLPASRAA